MSQIHRIDPSETTQTAEPDHRSAVFSALQQQASEEYCAEPGAASPMDEHAFLAAKLEAMAEFAAGAGHEINNPLAAISGRAQLLLRDETDPERRRHLLTIGAQALRIRDMIGDVMLFARPPEPEPRTVELSTVIEEVTGKFTDELAVRRLSISGERTADAFVWADETQLRIVLSELLRNAIRFSAEAGLIEINVERRSADWVTFSVSDDGPGLSETDREHLFDPFYSGRQAGRGLGFGLPKCWRIVTTHGGQIRADNTQASGFRIIVDWPSTKTAGHSSSPVESSSG